LIGEEIGEEIEVWIGEEIEVWIGEEIVRNQDGNWGEDCERDCERDWVEKGGGIVM
jgi:hypothetical protein